MECRITCDNPAKWLLFRSGDTMSVLNSIPSAYCDRHLQHEISCELATLEYVNKRGVYMIQPIGEVGLNG